MLPEQLFAGIHFSVASEVSHACCPLVGFSRCKCLVVLENQAVPSKLKPQMVLSKAALRCARAISQILPIRTGPSVMDVPNKPKAACVEQHVHCLNFICSQAKPN